MGRRPGQHPRRRLIGTHTGVRAALAATLCAALVGTLGAPPAFAAWSGQWWLSNYGISAAWAMSQGKGVTVAVVDSGVVATLGDLRGRVLAGRSFVGSGDGRADPGQACDSAHPNCFSHGTDMATLIAGTGRGAGMVGIAPQASILPVKVSVASGQETSNATIAAGVRWAVDHGAKVISMSVGDSSATCSSPQLRAATIYAYQHDVISVAAAGNDGVANTGSPANCPGVLTISAVDRNSRPWARTNYGPNVDFASAGVDTVQETLQGRQLSGGNGTSDATAIAAGVFALLRARFPAESARTIVTRALRNVANGIGGGIKANGRRVDDRLGYGQILPYYALKDIAPPASARNPIYDAWAREIGPPTPGASASPGPSGSAPSRAGTATSSVPPAATSPTPSSSNTGLVAGVIGAVVVVAIGTAVLWLRLGRRRA